MLVKLNKLFDNNLMYQQSHNYDYAISTGIFLC